MRKDMWIRPLKGLCGFGLISFTDVLPDAVGISCCFPVNYTSPGHMPQEKKKKKSFPSKQFNQNRKWFNNLDFKRLCSLTQDEKNPLNIISVISWSTTFWITRWVHLDRWQMTRWMFAIKEGRTGQSGPWAWLTKRGVLIRDTWDTGPTEHSALNETRQGNTISHTVIQNNRLASSRNGSIWLLNCLQTCGWTNWNLVGFFLLGINEEHVGRKPGKSSTVWAEKELINTAENDSPWMNLRVCGHYML